MRVPIAKSVLRVAAATLIVAGAGIARADDHEYVHVNRSVETLAAGEAAFGIFSGDFSLTNARALARSDLDFVFIDMEHTPFDAGVLRNFLLGMTDVRRAIEKGNAQRDVTPLVRIPMNGRENMQWFAKQALDMGAQGIVFPFVETRDQAVNAVASMRYPQPAGDPQPEPTGIRGASPGIAAWNWGVGDYMTRADVWPLDPRGDLLAVLQIETREGVENIEEIAAVPGVGAIFIGPSDLSLSYGYPGQRDHPLVADAIDRVLQACLDNDVPCGLTTNADSVADYLDEGFRFVTVGYWNDAGISDGVAKGLAAGRAAAGRDD
jgi:4-hydroxy-2-oxoheptanedioate aldolase